MAFCGRDSQNDLMSKEEIGVNDALLNVFEKTQEQYALPHSKDRTGQLYTDDDEICKIREKEANKWKDCIKEKDEMISVFKLRESLLKSTVDDLNKQLGIQNKLSLNALQESHFLRMRVKQLEELNLKSTPSADKENMETVEAKEHHQKIHEEEPLEKEMSKSVDEESNVSDKMLILQEEIESFQNVIVSKNEQIQQLQSMIDTNEERMNELESKLKQLQTTVTDKDTQIEELEAQIANNQIFPTHVPVVLTKEEEQCACWPLPKTVQETDQEDSIHWVTCKTLSLTKEEELYWSLPKTVQETDRKDTIHWVMATKEICYLYSMRY